jgi:hypothetical protein
MQSAGISRHFASCKVCFDAGQHHLCNTHKPKGDFYPQGQAAVIQGGWPINNNFGQITLCPVLQNTVCTNPQCFNGQNGQIRFPCFGHSISHCPCQWPQEWQMGGNMEHMRYTGYSQQQWRQIEQHNHMMQQQHMMHVSHQEHLLPSPSPLERQTATTPISSDEELQTSISETEVEENKCSFIEPLDLPQMDLKQREQLLKQEVETLRKQLQEKGIQASLLQQENKPKKEKMSWADMCDSEQEDEEGDWKTTSWDQENDSDDEFAKVAPELDGEEQEQSLQENQGWKTLGKGEWKTVSARKKKSSFGLPPKTTNEKKEKETRRINSFALLRATSD